MSEPALGDGVRLRRVGALLTDREWAWVQSFPRNERAGKMGVILANARDAGIGPSASKGGGT